MIEWGSYYDEKLGIRRRIRKGEAEAARECDRYNAISREIDELELRLQMQHSKREVTRERAFAALPDGYGITMSPDHFELVNHGGQP